MVNDKATPEERQESRLITQMRESLVNLASKHEKLTIENERLTIENERLIREIERLTIENEFYRGIQEILDSDFDDANQIKSALQKLLSETINH